MEPAKSRLSQLKRLDFIPKVHDDAKARSPFGAALSVVVAALIVFLVVHEVLLWSAPDVENTLGVDTFKEAKMYVHLDISFPRLACSKASLDALDSTGAQQIGLAHTVHKDRLDAHGRPVMTLRQDGLGERAQLTPHLPDHYCGSCFGAERVPGECCNTCAELRAAFAAAGRAESLALAAEQCVRDAGDVAEADDEGCRLYGHFTVAKIKGEFHVAAGHSFPQAHGDHTHHIHRFNTDELGGWNSTHVINRLAFGPPFPTMNQVVSPLERHVNEMTGLQVFQYHIRVVPVTYTSDAGALTIHSNQYSASEHVITLSTAQLAHYVPGIYFKYDISPLRIQYAVRQRPLANLLVSLASVPAGVFVVVGMLYQYSRTVVEALSKLA